MAGASVGIRHFRRNLWRERGVQQNGGPTWSKNGLCWYRMCWPQDSVHCLGSGWILWFMADLCMCIIHGNNKVTYTAGGTILFESELGALVFWSQHCRSNSLPYRHMHEREAWYDLVGLDEPIECLRRQMYVNCSEKTPTPVQVSENLSVTLHDNGALTSRSSARGRCHTVSFIQ